MEGHSLISAPVYTTSASDDWHLTKCRLVRFAKGVRHKVWRRKFPSGLPGAKHDGVWDSLCPRQAGNFLQGIGPTTVMYGERKHTIFCQFSVTDDGSFVCSLGTRGRCEEKTVNVSAAL